jgi:hypothetical protein
VVFMATPLPWKRHAEVLPWFDALQNCSASGDDEVWSKIGDDRLRANIGWLLSSEPKPPPFGWYHDKRRQEGRQQRLVTLLKVRDDAVTSLRSISEEAYTRLQNRVQNVATSMTHDEELEMNKNLGEWMSNKDNHLLVRWLIEAEFLDEYAVDKENPMCFLGTQQFTNFERVHEVNFEQVDAAQEGSGLEHILQLMFSEGWKAIVDDNARSKMGPAGRLLTYWVKGEYLGSRPFHEYSGFASYVQEVGERELQIDQRKSSDSNNPGRIPTKLKARLRLHAISRVEVTANIRSEVTDEKGAEREERWRLCDIHKTRFDHVLSETWSVCDDNWDACARRGVAEELNLTEDESNGLMLLPQGGLRLEVGESNSMEGVHTLTLVQDFTAEITSSERFLELDEKKRIPQKQFEIPDAGLNSKLVWVPILVQSEVPARLFLPYDESSGPEPNKFYAIHYDRRKIGAQAYWLIGAATVIHAVRDSGDWSFDVNLPSTGTPLEKEAVDFAFECLENHPLGDFLLQKLKLATVDTSKFPFSRNMVKKIKYESLKFAELVKPAQRKSNLIKLSSPFTAPDVNLVDAWSASHGNRGGELFEQLARALPLFDDRIEHNKLVFDVVQGLLQNVRTHATEFAQQFYQYRADTAEEDELSYTFVPRVLTPPEKNVTKVEGHSVAKKKSWQEYRRSVVEVVRYLCTAPCLKAAFDDQMMVNVANIAKGSSKQLDQIQDVESYYIKGDGSQIELQHGKIDIALWSNNYKAMQVDGPDSRSRNDAIGELRKQKAIEERYC